MNALDYLKSHRTQPGGSLGIPTRDPAEQSLEALGFRPEGFLDPRPGADLVEERRLAEDQLRDRTDQAMALFGLGLGGAHVSREGVRQFRAMAERGIRHALAVNLPEAFGRKWRHVLQCYRAVGQLAAFGKSTVDGAAVAFAWNRAMHEEHQGLDTGHTDFCGEGEPPPGD